MKWLSNTLVIFLLSLVSSGTFAQDPDLPMDHITLDSFTVTAVKEGLNIQDLIDIMQYDSTLYIAFNNLHFTDYSYRHTMRAYDKRERLEASKREIIRQEWDGTCREQFIDSSIVEGDWLNRRGKEKYYTAELFNRTFYQDGRVCHERRKSNYRDMIYGSKEDGHVDAIKRVVFNPGSPVDLPLIGKKFGVFKPHLINYYDYSIESKEVAGMDCYVFTVNVKPEYADHPKEVIIRKLTTTFNKKDFQVMRRDYHLYYNGILVKCDIRMDIILSEYDGRYYPDYFTYNGRWNVPAKRPEDIRLVTRFDYGSGGN